MKFNDRLFYDLSKVANGALSAASGLRDQVEARRNGHTSGISREEFAAVAAMAAKARDMQETLAQRIAVLEAKLASVKMGETAK